jgi:hypothetical protein
MSENSRKRLMGGLAIFATFLLGGIDWLSGYDLNFFVFYFFPVSLAAWFLGLGGSIFLAILSSMVWFGADALTGHLYSSHVFAVWNTMIRLISFLAIGWSVSTLKRALDREKEVTKKLNKSLSEIKVLESFLPICAQCKKIRDDHGVWQHPEEYISQHTNTRFSHGYCPDCYKRAVEEAGFLDEHTEP